MNAGHPPDGGALRRRDGRARQELPLRRVRPHGVGEAEATKVQDLYLAGRKPEAIASVPLAMVEDMALVGPVDKIRAELDQWRETCITTMLVSGPKEALPFYAELILG